MAMVVKPEESQTRRFCELTRTGVTVGLVSFVSVLFLEIFRRAELAQSQFYFGMTGLAVAGLVLLLTDVPALMRAGRHEEILSFYKRRYYWGSLLMLCGAVVFIFRPEFKHDDPAPILVVRAQELPKPEPLPEIVFPDLQVDAIILNGERSTAMIEGIPRMIGEGIRGVRIVAITETHITVELSGVRKEVPIFQASETEVETD